MSPINTPHNARSEKPRSASFSDHLTPEQLKFFEKNRFFEKAKQQIGVEIKPEQYLDKWGNGIIFIVPETNILLKFPLHEDGAIMLENEAEKHDIFYRYFTEITQEYKAFSKTEKWELVNTISVPKLHSVFEKWDVYTMEYIKHAEPINYFKHCVALQSAYSEILKTRKINLSELNYDQVQKLSQQLQKEFPSIKNPGYMHMQVPLIVPEQFDVLIDLIRGMNSRGFLHRDLHGRNFLISRETISPDSPYRKIYIIDFGTLEVPEIVRDLNIKNFLRIPLDLNIMKHDDGFAGAHYLDNDTIDIVQTVDTFHKIIR